MLWKCADAGDGQVVANGWEKSTRGWLGRDKRREGAEGQTETPTLRPFPKGSGCLESPIAPLRSLSENARRERVGLEEKETRPAPSPDRPPRGNGRAARGGAGPRHCTRWRARGPGRWGARCGDRGVRARCSCWPCPRGLADRALGKADEGQGAGCEPASLGGQRPSELPPPSAGPQFLFRAQGLFLRKAPRPFTTWAWAPGPRCTQPWERAGSPRRLAWNKSFWPEFRPSLLLPTLEQKGGMAGPGEAQWRNAAP